EPDTQCFVADTLGELLRFYAAADVDLVAGSLEPIGGHNVLEPALLGKPIVVGPHTFNFAEITELLIGQGAAVRIRDERALGGAVCDLLGDPQRMAGMGRTATAIIARERGALDRTLSVVARIVR